MANQQHIEWLLEGVEAWNARRAREDFEPDFEGADLTAILGDVFGREDIFDVPDMFSLLKLDGCNFSSASFRDANLSGVSFVGADLKMCDFSNCNLDQVDFSGADVSSTQLVLAGLALDDKGTALQVGLGQVDFRSAKNLSQDQLNSMNGDSETLIPKKLTRPEHWPPYRASNSKLPEIRGVMAAKEGAMPEQSESSFLRDSRVAVLRDSSGAVLRDSRGGALLARRRGSSEASKFPAHPPSLPQKPNVGNSVTTTNGRLMLAVDPSPPQRSDLEAIYEEVKGSANDLRRLGNIGNMSAIMESSLKRFLDILPENYSDIEQVRFGVSIATFRLRFEAERADLAASAPEKIGHIEALLCAADLIIARLPEWQVFLAEEQEERKIIADHIEEVDDLLEEAADHLENAPDTFDPSIFQRIREYIDAKSLEGYLAGADLLINIAHKTFSLVLDFLKDTVSASRKIAVHAIATTLVSDLGLTFLKLAGILPNKYQWLVNWLEFLQRIL